jgi:hypothetical protein
LGAVVVAVPVQVKVFAGLIFAGPDVAKLSVEIAGSNEFSGLSAIGAFPLGELGVIGATPGQVMRGGKIGSAIGRGAFSGWGLVTKGASAPPGL